MHFCLSSQVTYASMFLASPRQNSRTCQLTRSKHLEVAAELLSHSVGRSQSQTTIVRRFSKKLAHQSQGKLPWELLRPNEVAQDAVPSIAMQRMESVICQGEQ